MHISKYWGLLRTLPEIFIFHDNKAEHTYMLKLLEKLSIQKFPHFQAPLQLSISIWNNTSFLKRFQQKLTCNLS